MSFKETLVGPIPNNWSLLSVGELANQGVIEKPLDGNHGGIHPKGSDFVEKGIPFIMASDIKNGSLSFDDCKYISESQAKQLRKGFAKEGDVLITHKATIGRVALVKNIPYKFIMLTPQVTYYRVINNKKLNNKYLKYYFEYDKFKSLLYQWSGAGSTRSYIGITEQLKLPIVVPPIEEQNFISGILSSIDDKIELNNAINKNLEEMAQTLFKRWFVDFEFPNENGEPYKSSGGEFEESELGLIPKGWSVDCLEGIADYLNGLAMQKYRPEGEQFIPVIKIKELNQGRTSSDSDKASLNIDKKYIVNNGDVLFSWSGTLEIKLWCGGIGGLNQHLFKVTSNIYDKWFYYFWTKHHIEKFRRIASDKATTMGHIKRSDLKEAKVLIPDRTFYRNATAVFQPIVDKMIQLSIESYELERIRDTLLPKLMSGEIRVPVEQP